MESKKSSITRLALRYAAVTGLLILTFDFLADLLVLSNRQFAFLHIFLAVFTVLLLYWLLKRELQARERVETQRLASEQQRAEISVLLESTRAVLAYRKFKDGARVIFDSCKNLLGVTAGYIAVLTDEKSKPEITLFDPGSLSTSADSLLPRPDRELWLEIFQNNNVVYQNNFGRSKWLNSLAGEHPDLENALFTPLTVKGIIVGMMGLFNKQDAFSEKDTHLASVFSELIAIILYHSRVMEAMERSEELFRSVAQTASEGIITVDYEGKIIFWNKAATDIFGYPAEEAMGQSLMLVMPTRFREIHQQGLARMRSTGGSQLGGRTVEVIGLKKNSSEFPMELSLSSWKSKDKLFFTGIIRDITERKQAQEALRQAHDELELQVQKRTAELAEVNASLQAEILQHIRTETELRSSEERFRQLAENIDEVFWVARPNFSQIIYVSPAYETIWGRTCESLYRQPQSFLEAIYPADRAAIVALVESQAQESHDERFRIQRPDGMLRWIRTRTFPVQNQEGEVYRIVGISQDVTESIEAYHLLEQRVEERTRELSTLLVISRQVALSRELEPTIDFILDQLKTVVDYHGAILYKLSGDTFIVLAHRGPPEPETIPEYFFLKDSAIRMGLALNPKPIIIPDLQNATLAAQVFRTGAGAHFEMFYGQGRSWLGVPLVIKNQVIGFLDLQHSEANYYTEAQANLVLAFANQAAVAIENSRFLEQTQTLAAMQERQRLARDLHDSVSQTIFSACLAAEVLPRLWEGQPEAAWHCMEDLQQLTRGALAEMRTLLLELRPTTLVEIALPDLLAQLVEVTTRRGRLPVTLEVGQDYSIPPEIKVALYRIAQEALNNVVKHAEASQARVSLRGLPAASGSAGPRVELSIWDDGQGFNPAVQSPTHLGLNIMRERARTIGAKLQLESQMGHGTQVLAIWPEFQ